MNGLQARLRLVAIEQRQHLRAAVAAAHADEAGNRRIAPGVVNRGGADRRRSGDVALAREDGVVEDRHEAEAADFVDAAVELLAGERAGGSDDGEAIAWRERARLEHHRKRAISSAIARCSSRPSASRSARPAAGRAATGDGEEPLLRAPLPLERVLDAGERQPILFDRVDERLERGRLRVVIAAADQDAVAAGLDREHRGVRHGVLARQPPSSRDRRSG